MKKGIVTSFAASLIILTGCNQTVTKDKIPTIEMSVTRETKFDSVYGSLSIDEFMKKGFEFGDSVDVSFSTGYKFENIPFYDGYYVKTGAPLVVGYQGYPYIDFATNNKANCYQNLELKDGDTMTIKLNKKGKYLVEQETFSTKYSDSRNDYSTDEVFANFRSMKVSTLKDNLFYRGASPVDNQHNRAMYANKLIEEAGVEFILDLADSEEEMKTYINMDDFDSKYALNLYNKGNIALLSMSADFTSNVFQEKLANGLTELIKHDGPYYIHCTEGKDRTGFVCYLLEALSGASYSELEKDYMITYDNYFGISKEKSEDKYNAIVDLRFKDFINLLTPTQDGSYLGSRDSHNNLFTSNKNTLEEAAKEYLEQGGMSTKDINKLVSIIKK